MCDESSLGDRGSLERFASAEAFHPCDLRQSSPLLISIFVFGCGSTGDIVLWKQEACNFNHIHTCPRQKVLLKPTHYNRPGLVAAHAPQNNLSWGKYDDWQLNAWRWNAIESFQAVLLHLLLDMSQPGDLQKGQAIQHARPHPTSDIMQVVTLRHV